MADDEKPELTLEERAELERVIEVMTERIEANADDAEAYRNRAGAYFGLKQFEAALADSNKTIALDPNVVDYANRGNVYNNLTQYEAAIVDYSKAIELNPKNVNFYNNRGIAFRHLKQYEKAIAESSKAIELDPNYANAYHSRGNAHKGLKRYETAIADYSKAIELDPNHAKFYGNRGGTFSHLKQYEAAIVDHSKAIELDPNNATAYYNRGTAYGRLEQYETAIVDFNKAIELDPNHAEAYGNRGLSFNGLEQFETAIDDFSKSIELDPVSNGAFNNRGNAYLALGKYEIAIDDYDRAIELNPKNTNYIHNRAVAVAFQASEKDREEMSARLEEGFNEKLSEALEKQSDEFTTQADQLFSNLEDNILMLGAEKRGHGCYTLWLSILQAFILLIWLFGLYCYFKETILDANGFRHPMAFLPYISIAFVISTPVIWGLKILGQNILEAKSLKQDAKRRLFIENNLTRLIAGNSAERAVREEMLSGYFKSWQSNSPVEILLQLNSRRIGPETLLDRILPTGSKQDYSKPDDKLDNSKLDDK